MLSLVELIPSVKRLPRAEKLRLMQFLVVDLAQGEGAPLLPAESCSAGTAANLSRN